jgi:hypothetical protein
MSEYNELDNTIPVFCTARIPADLRSVKPSHYKSLALTSTQLFNEFFVEAFEAEELKAMNCTPIGETLCDHDRLC